MILWNTWTKQIIKSHMRLVVPSLCIRPAEEWKHHCVALWSRWSQVAHLEYLHTASIQPCKHVSINQPSLLFVSHFYLLLGVTFNAHVPHEVSVSKQNPSEEEIMQFCLLFLWEKCNLSFRKIPTISQLYYKAAAIHRYCMKSFYFFSWVTHLKIIHSTFVSSSWHLFLKLWPEDRKFTVATVGCSRSDQRSSWRCVCPGACEQTRYLMELVKCKILNNWIFYNDWSQQGKGAGKIFGMTELQVWSGAPWFKLPGFSSSPFFSYVSSPTLGYFDICPLKARS